MMMTAMAISPMMRNVLSVATMLPTDVMASDTATIAPTIVPMIRRMSPLCAPGPLAGYGRAGPSRIWRWAPQRPLEQPRSAQCKPPAMLTAGDSSRARTGNMCVRIADIEAVDNPRRFGDRRGFRLPLDRMVLTLSDGPAYNDGPSAQATWQGRHTDHSAHRQEGPMPSELSRAQQTEQGGQCMGLTAALPRAATV